MGVLLGAFTRNQALKGRPYFNSAAFLVRGRKIKFFNKQLLPTGDVFDEARFIQPGNMKSNYLSFKGKCFFVKENRFGYIFYIENSIREFYHVVFIYVR